MNPICPACGSSAQHAVHSRFDHMGSSYVTKKCADCGSVFYDPLPIIDYTTHTESPYAIREYVEQNANIETVANYVAKAIGRRAPGRFLDIGCGYGFSVDFAWRALGWQVLGIEPSTYGRTGRVALQLPIIAGNFPADLPPDAKTFDVIMSSEVIEHIADPLEFLRAVRAALAPDGTLFLSTPDAESLERSDLSPSTRFAMLSPGAHVVLYSAKALENIIRRAEFTAVNVVRSDATLTATAGRIPPEIEPDQIRKLTISYLEALHKTPSGDESFRYAIANRLFRQLFEDNRFEEAAVVAQSIPVPTIKHDVSITDLGSYLDNYPGYAPLLLFFLGMLNLIHTHNNAAAFEMFDRCENLCSIRIRGVPGNAAIEEALY